MRMNKGMRKRKDGRYDWRRMVGGRAYCEIHSDPFELKKLIHKAKLQIESDRQNKPSEKTKQVKVSRKLIDLVWAYYRRNIESEVKKGTLKPDSAKRYEEVIKLHMTCLTSNIESYDKDKILDYFNSIEGHRTGYYCFLLLKRVFADDAEKKGGITRNPMATMKNLFPTKKCVTKGTWINLDGQRKIMENWQKSKFGKMVLFYMYTGCRLNEGLNAEFYPDKKQLRITRTKTEGYGVAVTNMPLTDKFCDLIRDDWGKTLFHYTTPKGKLKKYSDGYIDKKVAEFLQSLGIMDKSAHDLRHTFSTNLYYLGLDAKKHQYLMGHSTIQQTYDTYTDLELGIKKDDILAIHGDIYPTNDMI